MNRKILTVFLTATLITNLNAEEKDDKYQLDHIEIEEQVEKNEITVRLLPQKAQGLNDTAEVLKQLPGANVNRNGVLTGVAQYRGLFGSRVNVNFDGFNMQEAGPNSMDSIMSHRPASMVDAVVLNRGIAPVSTGIETLAGNITVQSKISLIEADSFSGEASLGFSSVDNGQKASFFINSAQSEHHFYIGADASKGDSYDFKGGSNHFTGYDKNFYLAGYGYEKNENKLDIEFSYNDTGETGTPSLPMDIIYIRGAMIKFSHDLLISNEWNLLSRYSYQSTDHLMSNYRFRNVMMLRDADTQVRSHSYGFVLKSDIEFGYLQFGIEGDDSAHQADILDPNNANFLIKNFDTNKARNSLFAELSSEIYEDINLTSGLRYTSVHTDAKDIFSSMAMMDNMMGMMHRFLGDRFNQSDRSKSDSNIDASFIFQHKLSSNLKLNYGLAYKTRSPSFQERYLWLPLEATAGMADGLQYFGNINLKPEHATQLEIGFDYKNENFNIAPHIFYNYINDYIQGTPTTSIPAPANTLTFNNVEAELYGLDLEASYQFTENLQLSNVTSYVRGQRKDIEDNLYRIAPINTRFDLTYSSAKWSVGSEIIAYQKQDKVSITNNEKATPGYGLLNLKVSYQLSQTLNMLLGVNNVFEKKYYNHLNGYNRNSLNSDIGFNPQNLQSYRLPGEGRNVYATLHLNW